MVIMFLIMIMRLRRFDSTVMVVLNDDGDM